MVRAAFQVFRAICDEATARHTLTFIVMNMSCALLQIAWGDSASCLALMADGCRRKTLCRVPNPPEP